MYITTDSTRRWRRWNFVRIDIHKLMLILAPSQSTDVSRRLHSSSDCFRLASHPYVRIMSVIDVTPTNCAGDEEIANRSSREIVSTCDERPTERAKCPLG